MFHCETLYNLTLQVDSMKKDAAILIIDDDPDVLYTAKAILRKRYTEVETIDNPERIVRTLSKRSFEVVLLDMNFKKGATTGQEGLFWLKKIMEIDPHAHVVMNTAYGDIPLAVECMKLGAIDFLVKPWEQEKLISTVNAVYELQKSKKEVSRLKQTEKFLSADLQSDFNLMIGDSSAMQPVIDAIQKVAETDASVLILGENGTGKEVVARNIHQNSLRANKPFIKVDLGAISNTLFESELFGHKQGAFTDAKEDKPGRFEVADNGTLFLDEIGNLDVGLQVKLLTVLQNRQIQRVGDTKIIPIDVRLISATNSDIEGLVSQGKFRQDLLYRINTVIIELPPLRERGDDIEQLLRHFLNKYASRYNKPNMAINSTALSRLKAYHWPGNVRELQNAVERAVIMSDGPTLQTSDFLVTKPIPDQLNSKSLKVEEVEKQTIIKALRETNGKLNEAAKKLGIGRTTLYRKIRKYKINA